MTDHTPPVPCGCEIVDEPVEGELRPGVKVWLETSRIVYCPTHAAAPDLLAEGNAAAAFIDSLPLDVKVHASRLDLYHAWMNANARAAIAKAKGVDSVQ